MRRGLAARSASYAVVAERPERALAMLDEMTWPDDADRLQILDEEGREASRIERPAEQGRRRNRTSPRRAGTLATRRDGEEGLIPPSAQPQCALGIRGGAI